MEVYSISVVAQKAGVPADTIRQWERRGLLPRAERIEGTGRSDRIYSRQDLESIVRFARARRKGKEAA
jgi:DNA-binding transcriptional MerR regulator